MQNIKAIFERERKENPNASSFICFVHTVIHCKMNDQSLNRWFNKLVDKGDYTRKERSNIIKQLKELRDS